MRGRDPARWRAVPETPVKEPAPEATAAAPRPEGRDRQHLFPGRPHVVKVRYADQEKDAVAVAAQLTGLRPGGFVGTAALIVARGLTDSPGAGGHNPATADSGSAVAAADGPAWPGTARIGDRAVTVAWSAGADQAVLAELVAARLALRRYATLVNQAVAALHSGQHPPVWLGDALAGADRAVARVDAATARLARGLG